MLIYYYIGKAIFGLYSYLKSYRIYKISDWNYEPHLYIICI